MFTEISNEVVEFVPNFGSETSKNFASTSTETEQTPPQLDKCLNSKKMISVEVQTGYSARTTLAKVDDNKLIEFLRKILPIVEEELATGITNVFEFSQDDNDIKLNIEKYQTISLNKYYTEGDPQSLNRGTATWLSILTNNAPILVVFCSTVHSSWCTHSAPVVVVFVPKRINNEVTWLELQTIPVKSCIESLSTNTFNRDIFAGGTVSGDIYIWSYEAKGSTGRINEIFSDSTDFGSVMSMAWLKLNPMTNDYGLLSCHKEGTVLLWKIGKSVAKDKTFRISLGQDNINLSLVTMISFSNTEFVVGTNEGHLLMCSTTKLLPLRDMKNCYDPVTNEMEKHKFAVSSISRANYKNKLFVISCDISGIVYFHDVSDIVSTEPSIIIQLPLPFKDKIWCTQNMEHIISCTDGGGLEVYKSTKATTEKIDNNLSGQSSFIKATDNGNWIITGAFNGYFQIFRVNEE